MTGVEYSASWSCQSKQRFLKRNRNSEFLNGMASLRTKRTILAAACRDW